MGKSVNQLKWGSILSYAQMALSMGIGLVYTPFMIRLLGQSEYGLYNTIASTIGTLSLLNLGVGAGYIRYHSRYRAKEMQEKIEQLNGFFLLVFLGIGSVAFAGGMYMTVHLKSIFAEGITPTEYGTARVLMILMTINLSISFPMSLMDNIINANERYVFGKILGLINTVVAPLLNLPLLLLGFKSIGLVSATLILTLVADIAKIYYVLVVLRQRFSFSNFEKGLFTGLIGYTVFIAMNIIIDQINWNIDKLLLARFKGTASVAIYTVGSSLYSYYMSFSTAISGVFSPRIHRIVNETEEDLATQGKMLTELFTRVGRIQFLLLALIASGVAFFGKTFITNYWAGEEYGDSYYVALLLIIPSSIALTQNLGIEIQRAKNKHQFRSVAYSIMALLNLGLSIYLCQIYGPIGCAFGTAVSLVVANGIIMNIYYHKKCDIDILYFWKSILSLVKGLVLPIFVGCVIIYFIPLSTVGNFLFGVGVYVIAYAISQWLVGMNDYERQLVSKPIIQIINKVRRKRGKVK